MISALSLRFLGVCVAYRNVQCIKLVLFVPLKFRQNSILTSLFVMFACVFSQKFIGFCTSKSQINSNYSMTEPMRPTCNRKQMSPEIRCRADKDVVEDKKRDWATECNAIMSETVKNTTKVTTVHKLFENLVANLLHQYRHDEVRARVRQTECRKKPFRASQQTY